MIEQARQSIERRPVADARLDRVEVRQLQAADQSGVVASRRHVAIVPVEPPTTPHQTDEKTSTGTYHSSVDLLVIVPQAAYRAGLTLGQLAAYMEMDESNLSKVLRGNGHLSFQRLLKAPIAFWTEFIPLLGEPIGLDVSHEDIADRALLQMSHAVDALVRASIQVRRSRRRAG